MVNSRGIFVHKVRKQTKHNAVQLQSDHSYWYTLYWIWLYLHDTYIYIYHQAEECLLK